MPYLDWDVLYHLVVSNEAVDFIFIGPGGSDFDTKQNPTQGSKKLCYELANAFFIGKVKSSELQNWYSEADILLISYQEKYHIDLQNSHKMMEYLGSGKIVVATQTQEYECLAKEELTAMSDKNKDLPQLFNSVTNNLEKWNSIEKKHHRITFAMNNTYKKQIERIERLININD